MAAASYLLASVRNLSFTTPLPNQQQDWSEGRLIALLGEEMTEQDCQALGGLISEAGSTSEVTAALDEVGLDIYDARETLASLEAPPIGYAAAFSEQLELAAVRPLEVVLQDNTQFEERLGFADMLDRTVVELVGFCALQQQVGAAIALQQQADIELERVEALAAEAPWYPRGFTRSLENLAWGWTSDQGLAPCQNCVYWKVTVVTRDGCLGGALVEVEVYDGDASLVKLRQTWGRLAAEESVTADFPYQQLNPELSAKVTMAECFAHEQP